MAKKSKGFKRKTRKKLKQKFVRPSITKFIRKFLPGEKVVIKPEPSSHRGMPHPRFKGYIGEIINTRGESYIIKIIDRGKEKKIVAAPEHLKKVEK